MLSGKASGRVAPATAERIREVAGRIGYRPSAAARSLRTGASHMVCLAVPDVTNAVFGRMLRGANRAATAAGFGVVLVDAMRVDSWQDTAVQRLRGNGSVDGFLLFAGRPPTDEVEQAEPIVLVESEQPGFSSVRLDSRAGARIATEHLLDLGHTRLGHLIAALPEERTFALRARGMRDAVEAAGLTAKDVATARTTISVEAARRAGHELLDRADRPTAVFCDDDLLATGLFLAARELRLELPRDLSVVGFDDMDHAEALTPPLTTMRMNAERLGATAFALLSERLADDQTPIRREVHPVTLIERGSTAPPPPESPDKDAG